MKNSRKHFFETTKCLKIFSRHDNILKNFFPKLIWLKNYAILIVSIHKYVKVFYVTPCVKCASRAEIRIFTPRDITFRTILVQKTFSWLVWLHHSPSARTTNSHSPEKVLSHSYRNVLFLNTFQTISFRDFFDSGKLRFEVPFIRDLSLQDVILKTFISRSLRFDI